MAQNKSDKMKSAFQGMFSPKREVTEQVQETVSPTTSNDTAEKDDKKFIRMTYIVNADFNKKMKMIAAKDDVKVKDILNEALTRYLAEYEAVNGVIEL